MVYGQGEKKCSRNAKKLHARRGISGNRGIMDTPRRLFFGTPLRLSSIASLPAGTTKATNQATKIRIGRAMLISSSPINVIQQFSDHLEIKP